MTVPGQQLKSGSVYVCITIVYNNNSSWFNFWQEFLKSTVDLADLIGIHMVMTWIASKGEIKFLVAGMGWATAELVMTR